MMKDRTYVERSCLGAAALAGAMLALHGCSAEPPPRTAEQSQAASGPTITPISQLPFIDSTTNTHLLGQLLAKPTSLNETTAVHIRLPPPQNPQLASSLVRVIGPATSPQVLFSSDALAQLGVIAKSPGQDFFTAFSTLSPAELDRLVKAHDEIASGAFGQITSESVVFEGRSAVGRTTNPVIDPAIFRGGGVTAISACSIEPIATEAAWGKSLFIRDPAVVQDPARTWDPCTGAGTQGGVWTFAHLVRQMANGSLTTPEDFVTQWLSLWLNDYPVNSDVVPARTAMFTQVIQPWAAASGAPATLVTDTSTGRKSVKLTGPLNLDIAPFRLVAIVNRIDLGEAAAAGSGTYYGPLTGPPANPGELRFIFDVVQPNPWGAGGTEQTCGKKRFTTIFEYGVPGTGCSSAVSWAQQWTSLLRFPGFTSDYLAQLESMTESVVAYGRAPTKGNQSALNQIRTNEIALAPPGMPWELREFHLTDENPALGTDTSSSGVLRPHTVAQTPNDRMYSAVGADTSINAFVNGPVASGVIIPVSNPDHCAASYNVPFFSGVSGVSGAAFRGGNALVVPGTPAIGTGPAGHWNANNVTSTSPARNICARHQFSMNTCHGCHQDDTGTNDSLTPPIPASSTNFTHIDPLSPIPVRLSKFLTGGGPGMTFNVPDTQLGTPLWPFADLQRRYTNLFKLSHCTSCAMFTILDPSVISMIAQFGSVPVDLDPSNQPPFKVGAITDLGVVQQILQLRPKFAAGTTQERVDILQPASVMSD